MAEEDLKSEKKDTGAAGQPKFRQIRTGKDHAVVINGQQVVLFDAPKKVWAKAEVVLPGYHLGIYDRVYLRAKESRFAPVNLHRAYADSDPIVFNIPNFDNFLAEGEAIWIDLVSTKNPEASGYIFPYIKYSLEKEKDEEGGGEEKSKKKPHAKGQGDEGGETGKGLGFAGLAVAATGEAITGLVKPGSGTGTREAEVGSVKDRLRKALKSRNKKALKEAVDEAKNSRDTKALEEVYREASDGYEKGLFEDILGVSDFNPKAIPEEELFDLSGIDAERVVAGGGPVQGGEVESFGSATQSSVVENTVSGRQAVQTTQTTQVSQTGSSTAHAVESKVTGSAESRVSGSATTEGQAEISGTAQARQSVSSQQSVSVSSVGGGTQGEPSSVSETAIRQQGAGVAETQAQGGGSSVEPAAPGVQVETKSTITPQETAIETEGAVKGSVLQEQPASQAGRRESPARPVQGRVQGTAVPTSVARKTSSAAGVQIRGSLDGKIPRAAGQGASLAGQEATVKLGAEPGAPDAHIKTTASGTSVKSPVGKTEAGAALAEKAPIETQTPPAESVKRAAVLQVQDGQSPERPSTEEDALAQISPQAREAALLFMAKGSPRMPANSVPPVRKEGKGGKVGPGQEPEPGKPMGAAPLAGEQPGRADQDGETPVSSGKDGAGGQADKAKQKIPGGAGKIRPSPHGIENIGKSGMGGGPVVPGFSPAMESGEQRDGQSQGPADQSLSDGEEKPPQEENAVGSEGEEPQNGQAATEDQQQQNALSQALSDRIDKLAEDKKLDAEIKQVTKEANLALDGVLMEGVAWVWAAAIPSFGLAVLLGAIIGDFLWAFKNSIIEGVLKPLLRTEALKKKGEEIAKQIKISAKVKLNILAMNLIVAAAVMLVMLFLFLALWVGCNYPPGITKLTYKLSVVGALGGSGICESIDNLTSNFSFGGGDSGGAGASDSWACQPLSSGDASVQNLSSTCFGSNANKASSIAGAESGGVTTSESKVDKCTVDGSVVSFGLFQINISAQNNFAGLNCRSAFDKMFTAQTKDCRVINKPLYDQCVAAAKDAQKNIQKACQMSNNGTNWSLWGANKKCGF